MDVGPVIAERQTISFQTEIGQIEYELSGPWLQDARNIQNGFHVGLSVNLR
jgi:hypothetical protein